MSMPRLNQLFREFNLSPLLREQYTRELRDGMVPSWILTPPDSQEAIQFLPCEVSLELKVPANSCDQAILQGMVIVENLFIDSLGPRKDIVVDPEYQNSWTTLHTTTRGWKETWAEGPYGVWRAFFHKVSGFYPDRPGIKTFTRPAYEGQIVYTLE